MEEIEMKFAIYARYYFYAGTYGAPKDGCFTDCNTQDNHRIEFDTPEAAIDYLREQFGTVHEYKSEHGIKRWTTDGTYYESYGEYERPDYRIIKLH
jgi:hypothetical protein